jgi:multidrug efflux pump subunit AcrB
LNPVRWSLRYSAVTVVVTAMLFATGLHSLFTMPRREDPKITIRMGIVAALYPGATSEQVEQQVTKPIEEHIFRFSEVRKSKTYSTSRPGVMIVNVQLEDWVKDTDTFWSKLRGDLLEVKSRSLPSGVMGPTINSDFGDTVAVLIAVHGRRYGYRELKDYVERIEDEVRTLRAATKLKRYGEQKEQIYVTSTLERLSQYGVNLRQVIGALQGRNIVEYGGNFETPKNDVPLDATGLFESENQIRRVMVDTSRTSGQPVYIGDVAQVERRYQDPDVLTRFNGQPCLIFSVEMLEGNNIVDFGEALSAKLANVRRLLPPDLQMDLVANQPRVVKQRINSFMREFGIAIAAVILVTILLLPLRVATIAAVAIPVTVSVTFAALNALHIELHQVSIASLIVVLGMVVDDAIVIADNYVDLLDRGVAREEAAWRSATELAVPVLTATLTIVASFLPLVMISGSVGEFIFALPITVVVALLVSFLVAMLVTPVLCRFFIHRGLHSGEEPERPRRRGPLDIMQAAYHRTIQFAMPRKALTLIFGLVMFLIGLFLLRLIPERFFPSAERDQFVIDVWLPEGSRVAATDGVVRQIETILSHTADVRNYTSFVGQSAPRFYYNVDPQPEATNYAQVLVNTASSEATMDLVPRLREQTRNRIAGALIIVKELEQGNVVSAPVEARIVGDDFGDLKSLGRQVETIFRSIPGAAYVHDDYREDSWYLDVDVNQEVANRMGLTNDGIARQLAGSFQGAPVSTFWEGNRAVDIVLRLDEARRQSFDDLRNTYITSYLTGARVPLVEVATLHPEWQTSRIVRRNGVRTLTVRSFSERGVLASTVLKQAMPRIREIALPAGFRIDYGGDYQNQNDTFGEMKSALAVSIVAIFAILLFQFHTLTDPLVVMASIPLAIVGAALGLMITHNPFGFTAFLGLVSLSGVVVRNSIILVDYIKERLAAGATLEQAAMEAGERRLRPIFLTSAAAAVGVTPMIISGSSLWSPLASVIAVGLMCSMVFTLVVVPVLFVVVGKLKTRGAHS